MASPEDYSGTTTAHSGPIAVGKFGIDEGKNGIAIPNLHLNSDVGSGDAADRVLFVFRTAGGVIKTVIYDDSAGVLALV